MMTNRSTSTVSASAFLAILGTSVLVVLSASACGNGLTEGAGGNFDASPNPITFSGVTLNQEHIEEVVISNSSANELTLQNIELENDTGDALEPAGDWPTNYELASEEELELEVLYTPEDELQHSGRIVMDTNDSDIEDGTATIDIETPGFDGDLFVDPNPVQFPQISASSQDSEIVELLNIGDGAIEIDNIELIDGHSDYEIGFFDSLVDEDDVANDPDLDDVHVGTYPPAEDDNDSPTFSTIEPDGDPGYMRVTFNPDDEQPSTGEVRVEYNDGLEKDVALAGNSGDACLEVSNTEEIDFGPSSISQTNYYTLTLRNCSSEADLNVSDIDVTDDDGGVFSIDNEDLPGELPDGNAVLQPDEMTTVLVGYAPDTETTHSGELQISSDYGQNPQKEIPLVGEGLDADCPVAEVAGSVAGGTPGNPVQASNQDMVTLTSDGSTDPDGTDLDYEWSIIERPQDSMTQVANPYDAETEMEVDIVGQFQIELKVYDEFGLANCDPAILDVNASPTEDIHVQLVWNAPQVDENFGGPDPDAGIGTDLDIHYVHADSTWGANDSIYWSNASQNWGDHGVANLDIDALHGADPENINHSDPMLGGHYRVGVHYYCDNGYGEANATVRIYFGDSLYTEEERVMEATDDFWDVGFVTWDAAPTFQLLDDYDESINALNNC